MEPQEITLGAPFSSGSLGFSCTVVNDGEGKASFANEISDDFADIGLTASVVG